MKSKAFFFYSLVSILFFTAGCKSSIQKSIIYPANDEVLQYELPYDLVYLRTLEAVGNMEGWELDITEKEKGTIRVRNLDWTRPDDSDRRLMTFVVKRLTRKITTVEIAPESRHVLGGGAMLKKIEKYVSSEL